MSEPKRQHTVPACYLENWGINGNQGREDTKFYVLNVSKHHVFIASVNNYPIEKLFYDIPELEEKKRLLEEFFCNIEDKYVTLLRRVLQRIEDRQNIRSKTEPIISMEDRNELAAQFAMQIVRTQAFRSFYRYTYTTFKEGLPWADIPAYTNSDFQRLHTSEIMSFNMANFYANLLSDRNWVILVNHSDIPFFTSDNPGIFINHSEKLLEPKSPVAEEVTFYIPLSPTIAVELYHKNLLKIPEICIPFTNSGIVQGYNRNLLIQCTRFMFSNKNDFSCLTGGEKL